MLFFTDVLTTLPAIHRSLPDLTVRALEIASGSMTSVYDCLYVALAEREGCGLLTAEDRLARSLPSHPIVTLAALP